MVCRSGEVVHANVMCNCAVSGREPYLVRGDDGGSIRVLGTVCHLGYSPVKQNAKKC